MAPTIPGSELFWPAQATKWYWLESIADADLEPTRAEITAGTDLTSEVVSASGFGVDGNLIQVNTFGNSFGRQVPGRVTAQQSTLVFTADKGGDDVRSVIARGDVGYILRCPGGDVTGYKADVFPVQVVALSKALSTDDAAAQITVTFAITRFPAEDITLPATA